MASSKRKKKKPAKRKPAISLSKKKKKPVSKKPKRLSKTEIKKRKLAETKRKKLEKEKKKLLTVKPERSIYRKPREERSIGPGGKSITPTEGVADLGTVVQAGERIRRLLREASERLGIHSSYRVHEYKNEVDGEWRVDGIRGVDTPDILSQLQEALLPMESDIADQSVLGEGYWITVGIRWEGKSEEDDHYHRYRGMRQLSSNYRPMIRKGRINSAFSAVTLPSSKNPNPMVAAVEKKFKRKVAQIFIRIVWNPEDKQPLRGPQD